MIDLKKIIKDDETYKELLENCDQEQKDFLENKINEYLSLWQNNLINPLVELSKNQDFNKELNKLLAKRK